MSVSVLSEKQGMSGGKVSYGGALLLRTERMTDDNKQVSPHIHHLLR